MDAVRGPVAVLCSGRRWIGAGRDATAPMGDVYGTRWSLTGLGWPAWDDAAAAATGGASVQAFAAAIADHADDARRRP